MAPRVDVRKTYKMLIGGAFVRTESGRAHQIGEHGEINIPRASRKDVRDAVKASRGAFDGWAGKTAMLRGQMLYRFAEMLDARRAEFSVLIGDGRKGLREVDASVETLVWYAGWCDKLRQVAGTVNPVAAPYFTFTLPEPTGVVGIVAPEAPTLLGTVRRLAPALCGGNCAVVLLPEENPLPGLVLGEVVATSDIPSGVVNLLSGQRRELVSWLAGHMDVNAIDVSGCSSAERTEAERLAADNVKRVVAPGGELELEAVISLMEQKTVWHPVGK